jgi:hypothetical protein
MKYTFTVCILLDPQFLTFDTDLIFQKKKRTPAHGRYTIYLYQHTLNNALHFSYTYQTYRIIAINPKKSLF